MERYQRTAALAALLWFIAVGIVSAAPAVEPKVVGQPPPVLAPYGANDPIPKLDLKPHAVNRTPREAVESFLAHLSTAIRPCTRAGCTISGDPKGYAKAWELMDGSTRPTLEQFLAPWEGTVRLGTVQLEEMDGLRFFVELHRLAVAPDYYPSSFYWAEITVVQRDQGWRVAEFKAYPEDLVCISLFGHQSWRHDAAATAAVMVGAKFGPQEWETESVTYEGRLSHAAVRHKRSGEVKAARLVRTMEGSWFLLSVK